MIFKIYDTPLLFPYWTTPFVTCNAALIDVKSETRNSDKKIKNIWIPPKQARDRSTNKEILTGRRQINANLGCGRADHSFSPTPLPYYTLCALFPFQHFWALSMVVLKTARRKLKLISFFHSTEKHLAEIKSWSATVKRWGNTTEKKNPWK